MGFLKKIVKKIGKGIKKVAKKVKKVTGNIWRGIKKAGGKVMRAINKAGIVGQLGLMLAMPYAMSGIGSLIGGASGGLSATWTGFGNWANKIMAGSNPLAKAVGGIAKGIYHAGATAGKFVKSVSSFIDSGFTAIAQKTGLPNPIEGFSSAVKSGFTDSFSATNNFLFGGTDIQATSAQLRAAGVTDTSFTDQFLKEVTTPKFDEQGFNIEKMEALQKGELSTDFKAGQVNIPEGGFKVTPEMTAEQLTNMGIDLNIPQFNMPEEPSLFSKFGKKIKDFAVSKGFDYVNEYVDSKINHSIYGEQNNDTSIAFNQWDEIGRGIDPMNFFKKGDSYTPSLVAFYEQAENTFVPQGA
jgi:hypothetical protein